MKNLIRSISKIRSVENLLHTVSKGKSPNSMVVKLLPNHEDYQKESFRNFEDDGIFYKLDISEYLEYIFYFGLKTEEKNALYDLVKPKMVAFDIGVNFGETLLSMAKIVGTDGIVYGFEPVPHTYEKARYNIGLNNFSNIKLHNVAISNSLEKLHFDMNVNHNSGGIKMNKHQGTNLVDAVPLDHFVQENNINKIDLIKIDIEGFEMNALLGAEKILSKFKPILFVEIDENNLSINNSSASQLLSYLKDFGYDFYNAQTNKKVLIESDFSNCHFDLIAK